MIGLSIRGVEVRAVPDRDNWIGLRYVVVCDHCKGEPLPHGIDGRPAGDVVAGNFGVAPFHGSLSAGATLALLAHVAFMHSTLPVEPWEVAPPMELTDYPVDKRPGNLN